MNTPAVEQPVATRKRPCPICGSIESRCLFEQRFATLTGIEFLKGYDVVLCKACGLAFADNIPPQPVFDAYYRDLSKYEYANKGGKESALDERRFGEIAETIAGFVPTHASRVLEIGCATGRLLALLRERGYANVEGLDPSPGCSQAAWELYQVPVNVGSVFAMPTPDGFFDVVVLIGVVEHIEDLHGALEHIKRVLSPNGRVYAEVPDAAHLAGRPDSPYQEFSTEHINFFSVNSLANLFKSSGFAVVMTGESVRQQHVNTTYPAAFGVFQKAGNASPFQRDESTESGLTRYIEESAALEASLHKRLNEIAKKGELVVWGTGTHTQHLIARGEFDHLRIAAFVDSNPKYHGRDLHGAPVLSPAALTGRHEPILISTRGFQAEIQHQIRHQLNLENDIILLYPDA